MSQPAEAPNAQPAPHAPSLAVREDPAGAHAHVPVLVLPADLPFEALRELVDAERETLIAAFDGRSGRVDLGERAVDLFDLRRLVHHLEDTCDCAITGLYVTPDAVQRFAERELKLKLFVHGSTDAEDDDPLVDEEAIPESLVADVPVEAPVEAADAPVAEDPPKVAEVSLDPDALREAEDAAPAEDDAGDPPAAADEDPALEGHRTLQVFRTVRSGSVVSFDGDVTVFGDVNPGAMVTASGSIVVMGALKGVAHAGATGDEDAFILGLQLQPTQLRIGRRIAIASEDRSDGPELALVRDGRIVIEPYRSSSMSRTSIGRAQRG